MRGILFTTMILFVGAAVSRADTFLVKPDGSGDFNTIQEAIDAAVPGDEVLLADGVFKGSGNKNITFKGKAITVRSKSGSARDCIIDVEASFDLPARGFDFAQDEDAGSVMRDFTIKNAAAASPP